MIGAKLGLGLGVGICRQASGSCCELAGIGLASLCALRLGKKQVVEHGFPSTYQARKLVCRNADSFE